MAPKDIPEDAVNQVQLVGLVFQEHLDSRVNEVIKVTTVLLEYPEWTVSQDDLVPLDQKEIEVSRVNQDFQVQSVGME